jgi:hypothetical protein
MFRRCSLPLFSLCFTISAAQASTWAPSDTYSDNQYRHPVRDFFFYRCVHHYFEGESLDNIDISHTMAFDYASLDYKAFKVLDDKAKSVATSVKARQHPGAEVAEGRWDRAPILAICLEASRKLDLPGNKEPR